MKSKIKIFLFGRKYQENLINFESLGDFGLISEDVLKIFEYFNTASEAWVIVKSIKESKTEFPHYEKLKILNFFFRFTLLK